MTVMRGKPALRYPEGTLALIMVKMLYRYESGSGLEICENWVRSHNGGRK